MKIFFLLISLFISSCVKVEVPKESFKYSVFGILNPDDSVSQIFVSKVYGLNEIISNDSSSIIKNAKVILEGKSKMEYKFDNKLLKYTYVNNGKIKEKEKYVLYVIIGRDTLTSETTIPSKLNIRLESVQIVDNQVNINVDWKKDKDVDGFYKLYGDYSSNSNFRSPFFWGKDFSPFTLISLKGESDFVKPPSGNFVLNSGSKLNGVYVVVESMDHNYFNYINHISNDLNSNEINNLFGSPNILYSNLTNGLGIFGSTTHNQLILNY